MNTRILHLICVSMCALGTSEFLLSVPTAAAQQAAVPQTARVNADAVRARETADLTSPIVFSLARGVVVEVLSREGVWSRIRSAQRVGWVRTNVLTAVESATAVITPPPAAAVPATAPPRSSTATGQAAPPARTAPPVTQSAPPAAPPVTSVPSAPPTSQPVATPAPGPSVPAASKPAPAAAGERQSPSHLFAAGVSYTPAPDAAAGSAAIAGGAHIAGHLVVQVSRGPVGVLAMGGYGSGTGYKSQLANAALSVAVARARRVRFDLLGGGAYYSEELAAGGLAADKAIGPMAGALLTLPVLGSLRGTVMASYMIGKWADDAVSNTGDARFLRVVIGLGF